MSNADAITVLKSKLHSVLDSQNLSLYNGSNVPVNFNFGACVDNLTNLLWSFYVNNGRLPNLIFNDGLPPSGAAQLKSELGLTLSNNVTLWPNRYDVFMATDVFTAPYPDYVGNETGSAGYFGSSLPVFNTKVKLNGHPLDMSVESQNEQGFYSTYSTASLPVGYWLNTRRFNGQTIPLANIEFGAFQTWGILLVLLSRPDFCVATDDGILLRPDGILMLEKSLAFYADIKTDHSFTGNFISVDSLMGSGPVTIGIPSAIADKFYEMYLRVRASTGTTDFVIEMGKMILSFVAFYYAAVGMSGLVGGSFSIANLGSAVSMAQKFGVDTGYLGIGLKVADLTVDSDTLNMIGNSGATTVDDIPDVLIDLSYDNWFWTDMGALDLSLDGASNLTDLVVDPNFDVTNYYESVDVFNAAPDYNAFTIQADNDAAMAYAMGPVSLSQYAASSGAAPSVASAANSSLQQEGFSDVVSTTPEQLNSAAVRAANTAKQMATSGDSIGSTIWATASKLLSLYGQYQQIASKTALPARITTPTAIGQAVRQPDGSISILQADGTISTVRPNGSTVNTLAGSTLPSFLSGNMPLYIGGGLAAIAALIFVSRRN